LRKFYQKCFSPCSGEDALNFGIFFAEVPNRAIVLDRAMQIVLWFWLLTHCLYTHSVNHTEMSVFCSLLNKAFHNFGSFIRKRKRLIFINFLDSKTQVTFVHFFKEQKLPLRKAPELKIGASLTPERHAGSFIKCIVVKSMAC